MKGSQRSNVSGVRILLSGISRPTLRGYRAVSRLPHVRAVYADPDYWAAVDAVLKKRREKRDAEMAAGFAMLVLCAIFFVAGRFN